MMKKILFLDRDGTLIQEPADFQIDSTEKFLLLPGVISALKAFTQAGYELVMISNQDGLGTEKYPLQSFGAIQKLLLDIFASESIRFGEILICPHLPEANCRCRKPRPDLLSSYLSSNEWDRGQSFLVGDRATDEELAKNLGVRSFLISSSLPWPLIQKAALNQARMFRFKRNTTETKISLELCVDGEGKGEISTGIGFFDHMLGQLVRASGIDLKLNAEGDLHIDDHHLVEDVGLALGTALKSALGDKRGIGRYGFWLPMDETSAKATLDISGRPNTKISANFLGDRVGGLAVQMIPHFFKSLSESLGMSLIIEAEGGNDHHIAEGIFKAVGKCFAPALARTGSHSIPSTKGVL
jgi:imidazoleglycerol-phosphate dehydratase/histidinol-phosphatase